MLSLVLIENSVRPDAGTTLVPDGRSVRLISTGPCLMYSREPISGFALSMIRLSEDSERNGASVPSGPQPRPSLLRTSVKSISVRPVKSGGALPKAVGKPLATTGLPVANALTTSDPRRAMSPCP